MINTLPMVRREFPDYEPEMHFVASLPLDHLRITTQVVEKHDLPLIAQYMLRAIAARVDMLPDIAHLLGLDERDLAPYGADLLKAGLIEQEIIADGGYRHLTLTANGRKFATEQAKLSVLKKRTFHFHYNRLSRQLGPPERDVVPLDTFRREDTIYVVPTQGQCPVLDHIPLVSVRDAMALDTRQRDQYDVVSLLDMQTPYVEYLRGIDVYLLRHRETTEQRFAMYRNGRYLQAESAAIQRAHEEGGQVVPDDADSFVPERVNVQAILDPSLVATAEEIIDRDRALSDIASVIQTKETVRTSTQSSQEREALEVEIRALTENLQRIKNERDALVEQVQQAAENAPIFLATEEHRPLLKRAFSEAAKQVIVISPWMNLRTVDDELCGLIRDALARGVEVHLGYGIGQNDVGPDAERKRHNARRVITRIEQHVRSVPEGLLHIVNVRETHEKILVCDDAFGVTTSFNWLSYRGDFDDGYRRETGVLLRDPQSVARLEQRAANAFTAATASG